MACKCNGTPHLICGLHNTGLHWYCVGPNVYKEVVILCIMSVMLLCQLLTL